jgi:hypothetical protein
MYALSGFPDSQKKFALKPGGLWFKDATRITAKTLCRVIAKVVQRGEQTSDCE